MAAVMTDPDTTAAPAPATSGEAGEVTAVAVMSTPVWTVAPRTSPWAAWSAMIEHGVRHLVVVSDGRCVGVLDDREVFAQWPVGPIALRRQTIAAMIRPRTTCVLSGTPLREVARVMNADRVDAVPVVDEQGRLLGVVTGGDIAAAVARWGVHAQDDS